MVSGEMSELKRKMVEEKQEELKEINLEMYREYQKNIRLSEELLHEIVIGVKNEENLYTLFLKAAEAIGYMTGDGIFFSQVRDYSEGKYLSIRPGSNQ